MTFIPPMLCEVLRDPSRLDDPRYVSEPKFDGQRAQIHVAGGRTVAAYSRRSLDLLRHPGLGWLREIRWPVVQAVLDGEICSETGSDGIQAVLEARGRRDGVACFTAFDLLQVAGRDVMPEPWTERRKRLDDIGAGLESRQVVVVPMTDDAAHLLGALGGPAWRGRNRPEGAVVAVSSGLALARVAEG